ncbi:hypothetical protein G7B40_035085 [Aetokthonos hydrillicola Thurmond2011]|jgi:hypothetical protein|uniref:Uncharacterized protein n=1 Tax=Aetokthonos hydrillicola Thurmond2011 TaxID=2712845 RepID=A0AAP5IHL9_9CYAN|nr:hypothetical protein [Aetokthonos hydrillicola CCALA 1050]MDR9899745.1 hypothetical protein [Aetokthonos hydrillicola Thurmond2011]
MIDTNVGWVEGRNPTFLGFCWVSLRTPTGKQATTQPTTTTNLITFADQ